MKSNFPNKDELLSSKSPLVMGIVNATPDSFFDGGKFLNPNSAVTHGIKLIADGADIVDIGGESTRPGAESLSLKKELNRVIPVVEALTETGVYISIDTQKAEVASQAVRKGACIINDVSAGLFDPEIIDVVKEYDVWYVVMHLRGTPKTMQRNTHYDDLFSEIKAYFTNRLEEFSRRGLRKDRIILDPGIGFGKTPKHNLLLIEQVARFRELGFPLLVGASRKSFIQLAGANEPENRLPGSLVVAAHLAREGVEIIRVHDVAETVQAVQMAKLLLKSRGTD